MDTILGIDLGTTNSVASIIQGGRPVALRDPLGEPILPSVVAFDSAGRLLVGQEARNQALLAPERTVKSIKRKMGQAVRVRMGDGEYSPQEISAMILRTLRQRAETALGQSLTKAVITVPAFFNENQREATREAGELAGLEVLRIINEPTAAALTYEPCSMRSERLLVYDLGGGTFDVSIVHLEQGVVEVLASHGDTHLGGDDFDELLLQYVCDAFQQQQGIDLRTIPVARSRLLQAVEEAKKRLSFEAITTIAEEFVAERDGKPLHLVMKIGRTDYERLIQPLLNKTLTCVDAALEDARLNPRQLDRVILVGGSTRTPLVQHLLRSQLGHEPHLEVDPDLCVSLGAAVQGGLIAGLDVGAVLVDITPHTLGVRCIGDLHGQISDRLFSPVIPRNTPLPAMRSEVYYTCCEGQEVARVCVHQGEDEDAQFNQLIGEFDLEGLRGDAPSGSEILVRFELDLDGILRVAAIERDTGLEKRLTVDNAVSRFRAEGHSEAKAALARMFGEALDDGDSEPMDPSDAPPAHAPWKDHAHTLIAKALRLASRAAAEDASEIAESIEQLQDAIDSGDRSLAEELCQRLEDLVFYLHEA